MKLSTNQFKLLEELINRYERKKTYGKGGTNTKGTILDINKFFPKYHHTSDSSFKSEINFELKELENNNFIKLVWEKYKVNDYLEKVYLNECKISLIYKFLNRIPKIEKYRLVKDIVLDFRHKAVPLLLPLVDKTLNDLESLATTIAIIDVDNPKITQEYLYGINELLQIREKEISKRHWSILLYNDSKRWELLETKILSVIKKELFPEYDGLEAATILGEFNVIENPKPIDIFGKCVMSKEGKHIDFSIDTNGVGLYPSFFRNCEIILLNVERIVTIENKTSYYDYLVKLERNKNNELVIYLGGYHNHIRTLILKKLYKFIQDQNLNIPFYHWGDIDFGGLSILVNLRKKTGIHFIPMFMNVETYQANLGNSKEIKDKTYIEKLKGLLEDEDYDEFKELVTKIIHNKLIVEQEIISL